LVEQRNTLPQDQAQYTQTINPELIKEQQAADKKAQDDYEEELRLFNEGTEEYERKLVIYEKAVSDAAAEKKAEADKIAVEKAKIAADQKTLDDLSSKHQSELKAVSDARNLAVSNVPRTYQVQVTTGSGGGFPQNDGTDITKWVTKTKTRNQLTSDQNVVHRRFNTQRDSLKRDQSVVFQQTSFRINYPDAGVLGGSWLRDWQKNPHDRSLSSRYESELARRTQQTQQARATSIKNAQSNAIKAVEKYSVDVTGYASSIRNFGSNVDGSSDLRVLSRDELSRREKIKPLPPIKIAVPGAKGLQQSTNREPRVGVKFESNIRKPVGIQEKQEVALADFYNQYKSTSQPTEGILTGVVVEKTGKAPTKQTQQMIGDLTKQSQAFTFTRSAIISNKKTGESLDTKTGVGSFKIASALGYEYDQNLQRPKESKESESETITLFGLPQPDNTPKNQKVFDTAIEKSLGVVEKAAVQANKDSPIKNYPSSSLIRLSLEGSKEVLATVGYASNVWHEKVETINFRGEPKGISLTQGTKLDYSSAYAFLGSSAYSIAEGLEGKSTVQFDEPKVDSMIIPNTFVSTAIENPAALPGYMEKYGYETPVAGGATLAAGGGLRPSKAKWESFKLAIKKGFKITEVPVINPNTGKIYPEIRLQKPLTIDDANLLKEKPIEVAFTSKKVSLESSKIIAPQKILKSNEQPTPRNFAQWDEPRVIPKGGIAPIKPNNLNVSLADKAGTVPKQISNIPVINQRVQPIPNDFTRIEQVKVIPKTGSAPINPGELPISLPDKAGKIPKIVPQTPIINQRVTPIESNFVRWDEPKAIPKTGKAPTETPELIGSENRIVPSRYAKTDSFELKDVTGSPLPKDFTQESLNIIKLKGSSGQPIKITKALPVDENLGDLPKGFTTGSAPRIEPIKITKLSEPEHYFDAIGKRSTKLKPTLPKGVEVSPTAFGSKELSLGKSEISISDTLTLPKRTPTPAGIEFTPDKLDLKLTPLKSDKAPMAFFKITDTDFTRTIPKTGSAPNMYLNKDKVSNIPTYDEYLPNPKRSSIQSKVDVPKGIPDELAIWKKTNVDLEQGTTNAFFLKGGKSPLGNLKNEFKINTRIPPKKPTKIDEPKETKPGDIENLQSKGGSTIQVMKPEGVKNPKAKKKQLEGVGDYPNELNYVTDVDAPILPSRIIRDKPALGVVPISFNDAISNKVNVTKLPIDSTITSVGSTVASLTSVGAISILGVKPSDKIKADTSLKVFTSESSKSATRSRSSELLKENTVITSIQKQPQKTSQAVKQKNPLPPKAQQPTKLDTPLPFQPKTAVSEAFGKAPNTVTRTKRTVPITPKEDKNKKKKPDKKKKKTKLFIGNVSEVKVEGIYDRKEVTRGKKKVKKLHDKDIKKYMPKNTSKKKYTIV
jgi:hypothetical protein